MTDNVFYIDRPDFDKVERYVLDLMAKWDDTINATSTDPGTIRAKQQPIEDYVTDLLEGVMQTIGELLKAGVKHPTEGKNLAVSLGIPAGRVEKQYEAFEAHRQNVA